MKIKKYLSFTLLLATALFSIFLLVDYFFFSYTIPTSVGPLRTFSCASQEVSMIVKKYDINKDVIESCDIKEFNIEGKNVSFVHLEYGVAHDCPSGCFYSHYCSVVEDNKDYPYSFNFYDSSDVLISIPSIDSSREYCDNSWSCSDSEQLTGLKHRILNYPEFEIFRKEKIINGGDKPPFSGFRWC